MTTDGQSAAFSRFGNAGRGFVIFAYGLFTISAQTLAFREFITSFESNDITVGIFFGCWFLWIALGAVIVNKSHRLAEFLTANIETLLLAYLPAFVLEIMLIIHIRGIAGIASYALLPVPTALILGALVNAPVSLITGMLFPLMCRWVGLETEPAVSRVYLLESLGSFIGGLGTTILLAYGVSPTRIFFVLAFILSLAAVSSMPAKLRRAGMATGLMFFILAGFSLAFHWDNLISEGIKADKWSRLLPKKSLTGSFQTAQAEYLYGVYQNQWIVSREGSIVEAMPDTTSAGRIIALTMAQNPKAKKILVIGSGLGLCRQFLQLTQIERLIWAHPDNEYVSRVLQYAPKKMGISDRRFEGFAGDVRAMLEGQKENFDLVIVNMAAATSSVTNRYYTYEFFEQVNNSMNPGAVLAICAPGGENIMGTELVTIGSSLKLTLGQVFPHLVIAPGDYTWFIASEANDITGEPGILRERFSSIKGGAEVYPPNGLLSIYLPERAAKANDAYNSAQLPSEHLINTDSRPLANLYGLLLSARQSDAPVTVLFRQLVLGGLPVFVVVIAVYVILRLLRILSNSAESRPSTFDFTFLLFSTGAVGIGVVIVLMYFYQTRFGSLYLYIGAVSSLYMAGLAGGAAIANRLLKIRRDSANYPEIILAAVILIQCAVLTAISFWPFNGWTNFVFAAAFIVCGLCAGCYFPTAGELLARRRLNTTEASARLEYADHFGAAAGGILAALVFVPVLGAKATLFVLILFTLANLAGSLLRICYPAKVTAMPGLTAAGYWLFGIAATLVICSNLMATAGRRLTPALPRYAAQSLAGTLRIEQASKTIPDTGRTATYFNVIDANEKPAGFIFSSEDFAPQVQGFGGKINLAIFADPDGKLINFQILRSNETPSYLDMLNNWFSPLKGRNIYDEKPFAKIDAVTGATISSKAILESLAESGRAFAGQVSPQKSIGASYLLPDKQGIYLLAAVLVTVIVIYKGNYWSRLFILVTSVLIGGFFFNAQFSTEQVVSLLSGAVSFALLAGVFILIAGVPLLALLFGNIYCGYLCPFGALQELVSFILPARFRPVLSKELMRKARFIKYVIAFVIISAFFITRHHDTLVIDPLIGAFNLRATLKTPDTLLLLTVGVALVGSIFYSRFWCLYLCPAGAVLSLFNKIAIFSRHMPAKHYANCEYGLTYNDKTDCIYCDKCRFEPKPAAEPFRSRYFLTAVLIIAAGLSAFSIRNFVIALPSPSYIAATSSEGQIRNVDLQKVRKMIQEDKLSEHEAEFYKKSE